MKVKWLGHASFLITSDSGTRIVTDPYYVQGSLFYGQINESADIVTSSHDHSDHNNINAVRGNPSVVKGDTNIKGIKIKAIPTFHDEAGGRKRGRNTIFCFSIDGMNLCHLGDLGHRLDDKQVAELGKVDILMIPVGGLYTVEPAVATQICERLKPGVILPMHYKTPRCGYPIAPVDDFLKGKKNVRQMDASEVEFKANSLPENQIIVLKPAL